MGRDGNTVPLRGGVIPRNDPEDDWRFDDEIQALRAKRRLLDKPAMCHLCGHWMTRKELVVYVMTTNRFAANHALKQITVQDIIEYCDCGGIAQRAHRPGETLDGIPSITRRV